MHNWHDYHITGYAVDSEKKTITLRLCWPAATKDMPQKATISFSEVEGYSLEHDLGSNIILYIFEASPLQFLRDEAVFFLEESRWGWPAFWKGDIEATADYLAERHATIWEIVPSYGLAGWVVAGRVDEKEEE